MLKFVLIILTASKVFGACFNSEIENLEPIRISSQQEIERKFQDSGIHSLTILIGSSSKVEYFKTFGQETSQLSNYDLASITKLFTATSVMKLIEDKKLTLDQKLNDILKPIYPEDLRLEHLLRHTSGFKAGLALSERSHDKLMEVLPSNKTGKFKYSDINYLLLGKVVEKFSNISLERYMQKAIFSPLGLKTHFLSNSIHTLPTTFNFSPGTVHDPTSRVLGGVTGHAGLFSNAVDLAKFASVFLNKGQFCGRSILKPELVKQMTTKFTQSSRGLGFDISSAYSNKPRAHFFTLNKSFGHTGYTGTSLWIDPIKDKFAIFLSNSVYSKTPKDTKRNFYKLLNFVTNSL